jgi:hypothetical protein
MDARIPPGTGTLAIAAGKYVRPLIEDLESVSDAYFFLYDALEKLSPGTP